MLYALVGRYRGAAEFGQMSLALALLYSFQVLALAGLRTLVTREIARDRSQTASYVVHGALVILGASALSFAALTAFVRVSGYSADTSSVILLLALSLPVYALTTLCDSVFQAWERMHFSTFAQLPVQAGKVAVGAFLLSRGYGLKELIVVLMIAQVTILATESWILCRYIVRPRMRWSREFAVGLVRSGSTFLGIDALIAVMGSSNVIFLSMFAGEGQVGLFSAANQLLVPLALVFQNVVLSVFPVMCRRGAVSAPALKRLADGLLTALIALAFPTVVGLLFLAGPGLLLIYSRPEFAGAAPPLQVMAWTLLLLPLTNVLGQVLVATRHESVTFRIVAVDVVVNVLLGAILIRAFGLMGAALTALLTRLVDFLLHYRAAGRLLGGIQLHRWDGCPRPPAPASPARWFLTTREPLLVRILFGTGSLRRGPALARRLGRRRPSATQRALAASPLRRPADGRGLLGHRSIPGSVVLPRTPGRGADRPCGFWW